MAMLTGAILSGGRGRRMGREKGLAQLGGEPLITHVGRAMDRLVERVVVSVARGKTNAYSEALDDRFAIVEDVRPDLGPLGGITSILASAKSQYVLFAPCDTPFLSPRVCELVISSAKGFEGAVPMTGRTYYEPLHGVYERRAGLKAFLESIERGDGSPYFAFGRMRLNFIPEDELRRVDPELESFWNINTSTDLGLAEAKLRAKREG